MASARKIAGRGLLGCGGLLLFVVLLGLALPRQWHAQRSREINASPEVVHHFVGDFQRWERWAFWQDDQDPRVTRTHSAPSSGVGAQTTWEGPSMGRGRLRIVESDPATGIKLEEAIESDEVNATGTITYERLGDGVTRVTWTDTGTGPLVIGGLFRWAINSGLGKHMEGALAELKRLAEQEQRERDEAAAGSGGPGAQQGD